MPDWREKLLKQSDIGEHKGTFDIEAELWRAIEVEVAKLEEEKK